MSDRKRKALIDLLEDPDERIYLVIKQVIKSEGQHILPMLTQVINNEESIPLQSQRAQEILYAIRLEVISQEFLNWKDSSDKDLLKAIITLTKLIDPRLDEAFVNKQMESIRKDVWLELKEVSQVTRNIKKF